ncbi:Protein-export membrane protein secD [Mesomycoplasma hyorhinis SK76]|uniref:Protein-export membrane protein secD n=1 Tax=Mesomycoplasma hyorhinis SK76 TaxID=1118964 RepID=A0AAI8FDM2_MESHY|nr:Protein-export membrane protein secD [Mesomycoplasma hyorhinis SK76]
MKTFLRKLFTLNNWKRWFIAFLSFFTIVFVISYTSQQYISKNINKSIEYGGGAEVLVQVKTLDNKAPSQSLVRTADEEIFTRLTGGSGLNGTSVSIEGEGRIRISRNNITDNKKLDAFISEIVTKPLLTITDDENKPLFYDGKFVTNGSLDYGSEINWAPPFKSESAQARPNPNNPSQNEVQIELKDKDAELEWSKATDYISKKPFGKNRILIWSNISGLINLAKTQYPNEWKNAKENIFNFIHVNENSTPAPLQNNQPASPVLKQYQFDAKKYLISDARVQQALNGSSFVINGNFSSAEAKQLALNINFGTANYKLDFLSASFVSQTKSDSAFTSAWIAVIVSIVVISLFMIVNYGLLGVLSTISLALYIFLTLLFFTVVRGEYSPITIAALIIGIGMNVDANIINFEILKSKIYSGHTVNKSNAYANKSSLSTILDSNITTLIAGIILFFFGTKNIKSFSITLIFSIIFTLLVIMLFTKLMTSLVLKTGFFDKRVYLLGIKPKYVKKYERGYVSILEKPDYLALNKYTRWIPLVMFILALLLFAIFAGINHSVAGGLNLSIEFSGGTNILIENQDPTYNLIDKTRGEEIIKFLESQGIKNNASQIVMHPLDAQNSVFNIEIKTQQDLTSIIQNLNTTLSSKFSNLKFITYSISNEEARSLVLNAILSVVAAIVFVTTFAFIRFRWTFSLAIIVSLLFNVLMVVFIFIIFHIKLSPTIVVALLSIIGYSINDIIVIFDKIKEIFRELPYTEVSDQARIKRIATQAIKETIKRSILTSLSTIFVIFVLMIFYNSIDILFSFAMFVGVVFGTFSSLFIATTIWVKLETKRNKRKSKRIDVGYWKVQKISEQTFANINDYNK